MRQAAGIVLSGAMLLASSLPAMAQDTKQASPSAATANDELRQAIRADKRGVVERNLQLTAEEAKGFWPIYDDYQQQLEKIVKRRNRAVIDYVHSESTLTDGNAKRIAREILAADGDEQKMRERNFRKVAAVLPARKAVRYFQIENKIQTMNRAEVADTIMLVR